MNYIIDAKNKSIGRVASEAAAILLGKKTPDIKKNAVSDASVTIKNASQARIFAKKRVAKTKTHFTGFSGGLRHQSPEQIIQKKGYAGLFSRAVRGMLPSNKLRAPRMKKLTIEE